MRMLIVALLLVTAVSAQDGPRKLVIEVDGKATTPFRARLLGDNAWLPVAALKQALNLDVKRETPGGPITVCRDDLCYVGPVAAMTEDDLEVDLDAVLAVIGATVKLKVLAPGQPVRYVIAAAAPAAEMPRAALLKPGDAFPDVTLERIGGGALRPSAFRGRKLVIASWASW